MRCVFAGPAWTLATAWTDPGGQKGDTGGAGGQWASASVDHVCTLRVTDSYGATITHDTTITINREPNTLPVASAGSATLHASEDAATQAYTVSSIVRSRFILTVLTAGASRFLPNR